MAISREEQLKILGLIKDSEINYSDIPATDEAFWQDAKVNFAEVKVPVTVRLEPDVLAWYEAQVPQGYQTLINHVLRKYMLENQSIEKV
ncbi:MAG: BrnA antitoxin family protein [Microcystaceae cyanobacterium]